MKSRPASPLHNFFHFPALRPLFTACLLLWSCHQLSAQILLDVDGGVRFDSLAGSGKQMVVAQADGTLSTDPLPANDSTLLEVKDSLGNVRFRFDGNQETFVMLNATGDTLYLLSMSPDTIAAGSKPSASALSKKMPGDEGTHRVLSWGDGAFEIRSSRPTVLSMAKSEIELAMIAKNVPFKGVPVTIGNLPEVSSLTAGIIIDVQEEKILHLKDGSIIALNKKAGNIVHIFIDYEDGEYDHRTYDPDSCKLLKFENQNSFEFLDLGEDPIYTFDVTPNDFVEIKLDNPGTDTDITLDGENGTIKVESPIFQTTMDPVSIGAKDKSNGQLVGLTPFGIFADGPSPLLIGLNPVTGDVDAFVTDFNVNGNFNVTGAKNFKIDHPLDPRHKYLYHACLEAPAPMNVYNGNVTTNEQGEAWVPLPGYFEALNRDFRYQLTVIGTFAQAIIAEKIHNNRFLVKTDQAHVEVSWQVTGIRHDRYSRDHPFQPEIEKEPEMQGQLLYDPDHNGKQPLPVAMKKRLEQRLARQ